MEINIIQNFIVNGDKIPTGWYWKITDGDLVITYNKRYTNKWTARKSVIRFCSKHGFKPDCIGYFQRLT